MSTLYTLTFENGNLTGGADCFDAANTDGGKLSVSAVSALVGSYGIQSVIDDTDAKYGYKDLSLGSATDFRFGFGVDPNGITIPSGEDFRLSIARSNSTGDMPAHTYLGYDGSNYYIRIKADEDDNSATTVGTANITDDKHWVEVHIEAGSGNGRVRFWVDEVLGGTADNLDNDDAFDGLYRHEVGVCYGVDAGTEGTIYQDHIIANDDGSEIGMPDWGGGGGGGGGGTGGYAWGDSYDGYEVVTVNDQWQDFNNIQIDIDLEETCTLVCTATCTLWADSETVARVGSIRIKLDGSMLSLPNSGTVKFTNYEGCDTACLAVTHAFTGVSSGEHTVTLQKYCSAKGSHTYFWKPQMTIIAVPE